VVLQPTASAHPLVEQRGAFTPLEMREVLQPNAPGATHVAHDDAPAPEPVGLTLQLLPEPRAITVEAVQRRDHVAPVRYRDRTWHSLVQAAGPDRISGGQWDAVYAREYFRAVTDAGTLVWLFRDAAADRWYLHGWWD
jgi:protein ImuB